MKRDSKECCKNYFGVNIPVVGDFAEASVHLLGPTQRWETLFWLLLLQE